ncbi:hypothetical protein FSP39_005174 [Pinctada imbricata]|uniref:t-SNARE coiled-coil homology domain-containing protein n=1 Tax=Pinctada imbricata TaxID=66713 RepID=A0AA88XD44_PINIB|nr:hypothetical protein FSP39_005174 [Pinctada imbricata]
MLCKCDIYGLTESIPRYDQGQGNPTRVSRFSRLNDWNGLHKENINATRTVQQIKANIKEIENTRKRIVDEDVEEFDKKTSGMKYDAVLAIQEFLCSVQSEESTPESPSGSTPEGDDPLGSFSMHRSSSDHMNISLHQLQIESEHDNSETIESWENLHQNLVELNTMIHEFSSAVQSQQESIDRIEDNIEKAHENVRSGVTNLSKVKLCLSICCMCCRIMRDRGLIFYLYTSLPGV